MFRNRACTGCCGKGFQRSANQHSAVSAQHSAISIQHSAISIVGLIARYCRFYLPAPAIDSAGHALAVFDALPAQPVDDGQAAHSVMTENHDSRFITVQFAEMFGDRSHWNEPCITDAANLMLSGFTYVNQAKGSAAIKQSFDFRRRDFKRQFIHSVRV